MPTRADHVLVVSATGWRLEHTGCDTFPCPVLRVVTSEMEGRPRSAATRGRFRVTIAPDVGAGFTIERLDLAENYTTGAPFPSAVEAINQSGDYVPSIPEPLWERSLGRPVARCPNCDFGTVRRTTAEARTGYRGHYALVHILDLPS